MIYTLEKTYIFAPLHHEKYDGWSVPDAVERIVDWCVRPRCSGQNVSQKLLTEKYVIVCIFI